MHKNCCVLPLLKKQGNSNNDLLQGSVNFSVEDQIVIIFALWPLYFLLQPFVSADVAPNQPQKRHKPMGMAVFL